VARSVACYITTRTDWVNAMNTAFVNTSLRLGVYWLIAIGEALAGAACTIGTAILRATGTDITRSRHSAYLATALGFGVWFLAFLLVSGPQSALRFYVAMLTTGIVIALQERYLPRQS
jgi:predicted small integral membrane protein